MLSPSDLPNVSISWRSGVFTKFGQIAHYGVLGTAYHPWESVMITIELSCVCLKAEGVYLADEVNLIIYNVAVC